MNGFPERVWYPTQDLGWSSRAPTSTDFKRAYRAERAR